MKHPDVCRLGQYLLSPNLIETTRRPSPTRKTWIRQALRHRNLLSWRNDSLRLDPASGQCGRSHHCLGRGHSPAECALPDCAGCSHGPDADYALAVALLTVPCPRLCPGCESSTSGASSTITSQKKLPVNYSCPTPVACRTKTSRKFI